MKKAVTGVTVQAPSSVSTDPEAEGFRQFLGAQRIAKEALVIRRIALRGAARKGVAVTGADLVPEVTITAEDVYGHPVGAEDANLLAVQEIFPLSESFAAVRRAYDRVSHQNSTDFRLLAVSSLSTPTETNIVAIFPALWVFNSNMRGVIIGRTRLLQKLYAASSIFFVKFKRL